MIANCPVSPRDITNAHAIFSHDLLSLCRKMTHHKPGQVCMNYVAIPQDIDMHVDITFVADRCL
jgi:hypothetical protein